MTAKKLVQTFFLFSLALTSSLGYAQGTRLLRQPSLSATEVAFAYGGDIWVASKAGGDARRITSTPAVETTPCFSPDGKWIAFSSNRSGVAQVYVVPAQGGSPTRLTWYPSAATVRGWTPDGKNILYASGRENAPTPYNRLWTVPVTGGPSVMLPAPWGFDGHYSPDGRQLIVDRMSRWDVEFRHYRGGQNTALQVLDLKTLKEQSVPTEGSTDIQPLWLNQDIYFLSDRDFIMNVWAYNPSTAAIRQVTHAKSGDIKWLEGKDNELVYEQNGYIYLLDAASGKSRQLNINVVGDFPWAETRSENVTSQATSVSLSPTGKRILLEARGDIFTVPVENGDPRNLTRSSGTADRRPLWSPDGREIAWFSDKDGKGYALYITDQEGTREPRKIALGDSKLAWDPAWSPNSKYIAFTDNTTTLKVLEVATGNITTADIGGNNLDRGNMGLTWSPDSKWLAYTKSANNNFRRIMVWSADSKKTTPLSDPLADAISPAWDLNGRYLYFLASTNVALGSGWANTSSQQARPTFGVYMTILRKEDPNPFPLKSDEEPDTTSRPATKDTSTFKGVRIDWVQLDRRIISMPIPVGNYDGLLTGPKGSLLVVSGPTLNKYTVADKKLEELVKGGSQFAVSANGEKLLFKAGPNWRVVSTVKVPGPTEGMLAMNLRMELNRLEEWKQIFTEAWRYQRDYFYDRNMHGRDWQEVWDTYSPLIPYIRHRADLTYLLDQLGGEVSVGHSFVFGGNFPDVDTTRVGVLGADLVQDDGRWKIKRIYTTESWNPGLVAPLAQPNLKVQEGDYILAINGEALTTAVDPYQLLNATARMQTTLLINNKPGTEGAWTIKVQPIESENALRQQAWVEDNRRKVDELSNGKLAYVWVPNTGGPGFNNFNRYYFAQQDKQGAVIDERFNGGGLLDDYMVDLMVRRLRASLTNEVPNGTPFRLPAGILGPKVLLINELAGSGGDFFPWVFRQQKVGPLIGARTWGGLVKSSVHYPFIDGGAMTAPDNGVFDPIHGEWIAENKGVPPDIEQKISAIAVSQGKDLQLERAVAEALKLLEKEPWPAVKQPAYPTPAKKSL
ncbi:S41 family peptidase [Flavisolibacter tropicus]|uniref:Tricorn protease homolog n=1 Tax=Flavisolibacter tropicus TaxID=1492898 RepID=A0A172TV76_9BACT|nr:S41 family peptidase [Flavisolibacter tropicus]ANE50784.1 protease [Flavisolibacter tropicus]